MTYTIQFNDIDNNHQCNEAYTMEHPFQPDAAQRDRLGLCPRLSFHGLEARYACDDGKDCSIDHCPLKKNAWNAYHANLFIAIMNDFESCPETEASTRLELKFAASAMDRGDSNETREHNLERLTSLLFLARSRINPKDRHGSRASRNETVARNERARE